MYCIALQALHIPSLFAVKYGGKSMLWTHNTFCHTVIIFYQINFHQIVHQMAAWLNFFKYLIIVIVIKDI